MELRAGDVAVVTGAASGIGLALATALVARRLQVVMADVEDAALDAAARALQAGGADVLAVVTDVADSVAVERLALATLARFGRCDLLVNNAGVGGVLAPVWQLDARDWQWTVQVNLFGVANGIAAFVPHMVSRRRGHVLNVSSLAGVSAPPFMGPYVATKHAVVALTETLQAEFDAMGLPLEASVACPGRVASRITESQRNRPATLQAQPRTDSAFLQRLQAAFAAHNGEPEPADACAEALLAGVELGRRYTFPHAHHAGQAAARARTRQLTEALA